ncbi:MAG: ExbD/TolR family protein [Nitrospinae bacterium]|nr:ExbD/TolR family protein [Nitrospinota bacterium]
MQDSGGKRFRRKQSTLMTEINITPFVDVMLVLLVIFMVTAPMMQSGIDINLPKEAEPSGIIEVKEENMVSLRKDGALFFNEKRVTPKDLSEKLKSVVAGGAQPEVYLRADKDIEYGRVVSVMGLVKKAGVEKLGMVTEISPEEDAGKKK